MVQSQYKPILLIEDDLSIVEIMKLSLELEGFRVHVAMEGKQALEMLQSMERPAVIFLDLSLRGMDGARFRKLQESDPRLSGIPVVIMSGATDLEARFAKGENVSFLRKPVSLDQVISVAKRYCGS
jgi:CheY-like chemotaxis protein